MTAICPVCGREFTLPDRQYGGRPRRYCSAACRRKHEKDRVKTAIKAAKAGRKCLWCGKDISHRYASAKFCSWQCKHAAKRGRERATQCPVSAQSYEASLARVRAYLRLPAAERWAKRGTLTDVELRMAEAMWANTYDGWDCHHNTLVH